MVGVWWIGFSQITFRRLPNDKKGIALSVKMISSGYREIKKVLT
jgi:UMF1 family MFS transporter